MSNRTEQAQRYLGRKAVTGGVKAELNIISATKAEVNALELFFKDECNNGLEPFIIKLPLFGKEEANLLVMFTGTLTDIQNEVVSNLRRSIKVLGLVVYTTDTNGDFILSDKGHYVLDDEGNYIALKSQVDIHKEITYGLS